MGDKWKGWEYEKGGQSEGVNLGFKPAGGSVHQRVHLERVFFVCCFSFFLNTYHKAEIRLGGSFVVVVLAITAITLKTVFNYLFVRLKNVLYGLGAAAAAVDFHAALSRRVQFTRQKRSDRGRAAGKIKNLCFFLKKMKLSLLQHKGYF